MPSSEADTRRKTRIVALLHSASETGQVRVERRWIHAVAYLSNVLSPMWDAVPLITEMLKTDGAPYDPTLQRSLESLVGAGLVVVHDARMVEVRPGTWNFDASYSLRHPEVDPIIAGLGRYPDELLAMQAMREVFLLLAGLPADVADQILRLDATYDDPRVGLNSLVTLYGVGEGNLSVAVTKRFGSVVGSGLSLSSLDEIGLYLAHLQHLAGATA